MRRTAPKAKKGFIMDPTKCLITFVTILERNCCFWKPQQNTMCLVFFSKYLFKIEHLLKITLVFFTFWHAAEVSFCPNVGRGNIL